MTFNTGNPIGSTDARDLSDNAENADILENSTSLRYHADRLGTVRKTRYGMQKEHADQILAHENEFDAQISAHEVEHDAQMAEHENDFKSQLSTQNAKFNTHISGMAISNVGTFSAGYTLTNIRQSLTYSVDGYEYSWTGAFPKVVPAGSTPTTSGGIGINAWVVASIGASIATPGQTRSRLSSNQVVSPAGLNAVVPYEPAVNPTLDLDFAKQKYRWYAGAAGITESNSMTPLITFSRSSTATYFDAIGVMRQAANDIPRIDYDPLTGECKGLLVEEQRTNIKTNSTGFDPNGVSTLPYVKANAAVAPNGTLTACLFQRVVTAPSYTVFSTTKATSAMSYTFTCYAKRTVSDYFALRISDISPARADVTFNLATGIISSAATALAGFSAASASITAVGNGWYKCTLTATTQAQNIIKVYTSFNENNSVIGGADSSSTSNGYIWGAQLEQGAFPTSYIPTPATFTGRASTATYLDANGVVQTAASGVARSNAYDYDSDGVLRPIGLLLEASATNQLLYSEQFDHAVWGKYGEGLGTPAVVTANYSIAPDGTSTADRVVLALNSGTTFDDKSELQQGLTTVAGTTYTQSVWLKTTDASTKTVQLSFNGENPKVITVTGTWQRFSNTGVASDTIRGFRLAIRGTSGTSDSADLLVWGAQQGVGSYPTSYIPTTSAQVTRAADTSTSAQATRVADDAVISGANFSQWYKQYEGTLVGEINNPTTVLNDSLGYSRRMAVISDGPAANRIIFGGYAFTEGVVISGSAIQSDQVVGSVTTGLHKFALAYKTNNVDFASAGVLATTDTSATIKYLSQINLGRNADGSGVANAHILSLKYYPKALSSTEIQAMTA